MQSVEILKEFLKEHCINLRYKRVAKSSFLEGIRMEQDFAKNMRVSINYPVETKTFIQHFIYLDNIDDQATILISFQNRH